MPLTRVHRPSLTLLANWNPWGYMSRQPTDATDVQDFAGHADPRTTRRYDRSPHNLDRHATYALASRLGPRTRSSVG